MESDKLKNLGLKFTNTNLGQAVFVHVGDKDAYHGIFPSEWSVSQLRAMADYMEANPDCTLFDDGSGKPVKL